MNSSIKYIGLDVHQATISIAVRDSVGKLDGIRHRNQVGLPLWNFSQGYAIHCT